MILLHPKTIVEGCLYLKGNGLLWSESVMGYYGASAYLVTMVRVCWVAMVGWGMVVTIMDFISWCGIVLHGIEWSYMGWCGVAWHCFVSRGMTLYDVAWH